ncbi:MAG: peptidoglycan DD-metalloendopeptidase family protein [Candidatus Pristimantibacillus sp.]
MNTKDGVRQRRQEKIKKLLEQQASNQSSYREDYNRPVEVIHPDTVKPYRQEVTDIELDPEKQWKNSPNPWLGWEQENTPIKKSKWPSYEDHQDRYTSHKSGGGRWKSLRKELLLKALAASVLFAGIWGMFQYDSEWTVEGRAVVKDALTEEIDFTAVAAWYKNTFSGAPSFIPIFDNNANIAESANGSVKLPIVTPLEGGAIVRTFAEMLNGIELAGSSEQTVSAVETGRVMLVTEKNEAGITIVVQHADQRTTVYGMLGEATVKVNDWVDAGDKIGSLLQAKGAEPSLLYFAVKDNDRHVDPVSVIPID